MQQRILGLVTSMLCNCLAIAALLLIVGCGKSSFDPTATPTPLGSRNTVSSDLDLTEIWRVRTGEPNTFVSDIQTPPFIFVTKDKVVFGSYIDRNKNLDSYLTALSLSSGEIIWQTTFSNPSNGTSLDSAYLDIKTNRLFLVYSFRVAGFDLETGQQLWITPSLGGHTGYAFAYDQGDKLIVDSSDPDRIIIEPTTGQILSRQESDHQRMMIIRDGIKLVNNESGFVAMDQNNQTIWTWYDRGRIAEFWPSFINENDLIAEFGAASYYLARINYHSGKKVWESAFYFMSNYALLENRVFGLTEDGALVALNLEDGHRVGQMQFDKRIRNGNTATDPFFVAISDPYLFTYFGDTQELVAFKVGGK
jgi:outer membrane protein assembly factor BamB